MSVFKNRYPGNCKSCKIEVEAEQGFTEKVNGRFIVWCKSCLPQTTNVPQSVLTADGRIICPYNPQHVTLIKSLPGAHWDKANNCWLVSTKMSDRHRVLEVADLIGLQIHASLREITVTEQVQNATNAGLYKFQVTGVQFLTNKERAVLGDEMGLGKTIQSLMAVPVGGRAMVVCKAGLKYNWRDEALRWRPDMDIFVVNGSRNFRWPEKNQLVIVNPDILPDDFNTPVKNQFESMPAYWDRLKVYRQTLAEENTVPAYMTLIVDEAHEYKNHKAARSRKVKEFVRLAGTSYGLTGSPLANRPQDLWGVLDVMGLSKTVFGTYERFEKLFNVERVSVGRGKWQRIFGKPEPIVPELLRRVMLRRLRAEVMPDLPKKTYSNYVVGDISPTLKNQLDALWGEFGEAIKVKAQLPPFEKFAEVREKLARSRVPAMLDYVAEHEEQEIPLVVFSDHLAPIDALLGRKGWGIITGQTRPEKRQEICRAFLDGKLLGIGSTIKAGGVGLNFSYAWKALFVDSSWSPTANWQAEDRLPRIGQTASSVVIDRMVSDHPLDLHLLNLLWDKADTIYKAIDQLVPVTPAVPTPVVVESPARMQVKKPEVVLPF